MITKELYERAVKQKEAAEEVINQYWLEKRNAFKNRMKTNPIFTDDELFYSRTNLCPCGHGLAYPKDCGPDHYWDCSAILKGIADKDVDHTGQLPFSFYEIKGELGNMTTRGVYLPKDKKE